jgi:anti-anti-sigma factor
MAVCAQTDLSDLLPMGLRIVVSQQEATTMVALHGEWDLAEQERIRHAIRNVLRRQPDRVVLDLSGLTFMDSSGLHVVLELARRAARLKIDLVVLPGPRAVRRLFELCELPATIRFAERRVS